MAEGDLQWTAIAPIAGFRRKSRILVVGLRATDHHEKVGI
jgi:hypothetical protein